MKQLLTATLTTALVIGLAGCKSTPKTDGASDEEIPRSQQGTLEHIGSDITDVGKGAVDAVGTGLEAIGKAGSAVVDAFKSDDEKTDKDKGNSEHPDHPNN